MSFANEIKDFVSAFSATSAIGDRMSARKLRDAQIDRIRTPTAADYGGIPSPFHTGVPQTRSGGVGQEARGTPESNAIASIESGGRYDAVGPVTNGDRPYGKHQIMGKNIGPWTKEALGKSLTPQQFLADPAAQEATFEHQFGKYVQKFGLEGAAQAWLGGPGSVGKAGRTDRNGTTIASYGSQFMAALGKAAGGTTQVAGPVAQPVDAGTIPAPDATDTGSTDTGVAPDQADPASSPNSGIQVDPVDVSMGPAPQVQDPWATTYAAKGGAIPAPRMPADNGWRPRQIGDPTPGYPLYTGPTPSQLAFRKLQVAPPAPAVTTPQAPATQSPSAVPIHVPTPGYLPGGGYLNPNQRGTGGGRPPDPMLPPGASGGTDPFHAVVGDQKYAYGGQGYWVPLDDAGKPMYQNFGGWSAIPQPTNPAQQGSTIVNGVVTHPAHPYMAEGGAVPAYAPGGAVEGGADNNPGYTTSKSYYRPGERRYEAAKDTAYWTPAKAGSKRRQSMHGRSRASVTHTALDQAASSSSAVPVPQDRPVGTTVAGMPVSPPVGDLRGPAVPQETPPVVQPAQPVMPEHIQPAQVQARIPDRAQPVMPEHIQPAQSASAIPVRPTDFAVTRQPPHLVPVIDNQGTLIGYTPSDQNGVRPPAMVSPNLPAQGVPGVPGWMDKERASNGQGGPGIQEMLFGPAVYSRGGVVAHYANGGSVGGNHDPNYTTSKSYYVPGERDTQGADVQATPQLMDHVSQALDGGVKFLSQRFGLSSAQGAVSTPTDGAAQQDGVRRFASGEGAATLDEIQQIDSKIDPERRLSEGDRQMTRLAKMTQWYLQQGRPKDAQAAAGSLLMYGSQRFGQLGALAATAYDDYKQTGDKKALWHAAQYMQAAYDLIPDGAQVDVQIKGDRIMGTRIGPDGSEQPFEVTPQELPNLIRGVMDRSSYWDQITRLADPAGYKQQQSWAHDMAKTADTRAYNERTGLAKETRAEQRARERQAAGFAHSEKMAAEASARADKRVGGASKAINWDAVSPLLAAASAARNANTGKDPTQQASFDRAASSLFDALPTGMDRAKFMKDNGFEPGTWTYITGPKSGSVGAGGVTIDGQPQPQSSPPNADTASGPPANIYKGDQPPDMPNANRANDGSWWMVPPGGGKPRPILTQ